MNIKTAKLIKISEFLSSIGLQPTKIQGSQYWYSSPTREDKSASLKVNQEANSWYDFGDGKGGNILDLVMKLYNTDLSGALRQLDQVKLLNTFSFPQPEIRTDENANRKDEIKKVKEFGFNNSITSYVLSRGINKELAEIYLKEIYITTKHGNKLFGVGFETPAGYEFSTKFSDNKNTYKRCFGSKHYTAFTSPGKSIMIFEGFWDYLSALVHFKQTYFDSSVIVLNSTSLKEKALTYIRSKGITTASLFLDNDTTGRETTEYYLKELPDSNDFSNIYEGFKDFNEYLVYQQMHGYMNKPG